MKGKELFPFAVYLFALLCMPVFSAVFNFRDYNIPPDFDGNMKAEACDIDLDGDMDIVTACINDAVRIYVNTGEDINADGFPEFVFEDYRTDFVMPDVDSMATSLCILHANDDSFPDIYIGACRNWGHGGIDNALLINDGTGYFTTSRISFPPKHDRTRDVVTADFNSDGLDDILVVNGSRSGSAPVPDLSYVLINSGILDGEGLYQFIYPGDSSALSHWVWSDSFVSNGAVVLDYDANGFDDVLLLNEGESCALFLNFCPEVGEIPVFRDSTAILPPELRESRSYFCGTASDLDLDGRTDFLVSPYDGTIFLFMHDGSGYSLTPFSSTLHGFRMDIAIADIDGDTYPDILTGEQIVGLYTNSPISPGNFAESTFSLIDDNHSRELYTVFDLAIGDFDGDTRPDIFASCSYEQNRIYFSRMGHLRNGTMSRYPADASDDYQIYPIDIDIDGDLDIFFGGRGDSIHFYENVGDSFVVRNSNINNQGWANHNDSRVRGFAFADLTGDGLLDFAVCGRDADNIVINTHIYVNIGSNEFRDSTRLNIPWLTDPQGKDIFFVKANADERPDILLLSANADQDEVYINQGDTDGDGVDNFTRLDTALPSLPGFSGMSDVRDIDGDGFHDIIVSKNNILGTQNRLLIANGDGTYSDSTLTMLPPSAIVDDNTWAVRFGDVNGDDFADILVINNMQQNRLYIYDSGARRFADATDSLPDDSHLPNSDAKFADIDLDGDMDIILVVNTEDATWDWHGRHPYIYINTGHGRFEDSTSAYISEIGSLNEINWSIGVGDFDLDGYPDFATQADGQSRLWWNDYSEYVAIAELSPIAKPEAFAISAYPNPFNSAVTIAAPAGAEVEVFDVNGRMVAVAEPVEAGAGWLTNDTSTGSVSVFAPLKKGSQGGSYIWRPAPSLPSGVYLVRASAGGRGDLDFTGNVATARVVYLK